MIVIHPLSGSPVRSRSTRRRGRLGVTASPHQCGLIIVSRNHAAATLEGHFPVAEQAVGRPDVSGRGYLQNLGFRRALADREAVIGC
jgi:hypothetical protein